MFYVKAVVRRGSTVIDGGLTVLLSVALTSFFCPSVSDFNHLNLLF